MHIPRRGFVPIHCKALQVRFRSSSRSDARKKLAKLLLNKNKYDSSDIKIQDLDKEEKTGNFVQNDIELRGLIDRANERIHARFTEPNIYWKNSLNLASNSPVLIRNELEEKYGSPTAVFKPIDVLSSPLNIGDVVELGLENFGLCIVVELPISIEDPRYTFVDTYGDIIFASKSSISFRYPKIFPQSWMKDIVIEESLFKLKDRGFKQIGKPKFLTEDSMVNGITSMVYEQALINNGHNLNNVDTFVIPSIMSQILAKDLTKVIDEAWSKLPTMNTKLELVHNLLQDSESPVLTNIFQLYHALSIIDIDRAELGVSKLQTYDHLIDYYAFLSDKICKEISVENNYNSTNLGKKIFGKLDLFQDFEISSFYAMILALRENTKLFDGINNADSATHFPLSINILPLSHTVKLDVTIDHLKEHNSDFGFLVKYLSKRIELIENGEMDKLSKLPKPRHYEQIINLMKLYCSISTPLNRTTESFLIKIMRNIKTYNNSTITSSLVYEALFKLGERTALQNPVDWSIDLLRPFSGISEKSNMEQRFYDEFNKYADDAFDESIDYCAELRQDRTSDVIYCIDSKDAHEVDDGIAIEKLSDGLSKITVYVSDAASYLDPNDTVSKIAFQRASTVYFLESDTIPIEMLPSSLVKKVELRPLSTNRAMSFSFLYDNDSKTYIENSLEVIPSYVKNMVNISYDEVDLILNGDSKILSEVSKKFELGAERIKNDLSMLLDVSMNLAANRDNEFNFKFSDQLTGVSRHGNDDNQLKLNFQSGGTVSKSQILVSECMVHTNALVAKFFTDKKIPTIYRILNQAPVSEVVSRQLQGLERNLLKDTQKAANFMSGTSFSLYPLDHDYIGLGPYCTVTSPLRRFQDLFSHWQLQSYLKLAAKSEKTGEIISYSEQLMFNEENVAYVLAHISSKNFKLKQVSRKSRNFFIFKKLQEMPKSTKFKVMIRSKPSRSGEVEGILLDYGGIRCLLKSTVIFSNKKIIEELETQTNSNLNAFTTVKIGDVIDDCRIDDIDLLSGDVMMSSERF